MHLTHWRPAHKKSFAARGRFAGGKYEVRDTDVQNIPEKGSDTRTCYKPRKGNAIL